MGWAEDLGNGTWRAGWRDGTGKRRTSTVDQSGQKFTSEKPALRYAGWVESQARRGETVNSGRSMRWVQWRDLWLAARVVEPQTAKQDQVRIDRHITPYWSRWQINKVKRSDVQIWVIKLLNTPKWVPEPKKKPDGWEPKSAENLSPATVTRIYHLFSASMKAAVLAEKLAASPCVGIKIPKEAPGHERYLERGVDGQPGEFDAIADCLSGVYRDAATLLVGTGMRYGEMAGLHWQQIDLANGLIHILYVWDPEDEKIKAYPKGKKLRSVPIPSWLQPILEERFDQSVPVDDCGIPHAGGAPCRSGLVITAPEGGALHGGNFGKRQWAAACKMAGVGHVRLHDLRHTYASWLVQGGAELDVVQGLLGHASILTTQRYAHRGASKHDRVRQVLG